jgi:hypothetical protein
VETSVTNGADGSTGGFPQSAYICNAFLPFVDCVNQVIALVMNEDYQWSSVALFVRREQQKKLNTELVGTVQKYA